MPVLVISMPLTLLTDGEDALISGVRKRDCLYGAYMIYPSILILIVLHIVRAATIAFKGPHLSLVILARSCPAYVSISFARCLYSCAEIPSTREPLSTATLMAVHA